MMSEIQEPQKYTRLHLTEEQVTAGLKLTISLDMVDSSLTDEELLQESIRMLAWTRDRWEQKCRDEGQSTLPTTPAPKKEKEAVNGSNG